MATRKHILLVMTGISPAIISEAFYQLRIVEKIPVSEVWVMTTSVGKQTVLDEKLLCPDGPFDQLCREYGLARKKIRFDETTIVVAKDDAETLLSDVSEDVENLFFPDQVIALVRQLTHHPDAVLHACLSGGRKSMSFYLGVAMMLMGRQYDELIHVIVPKEYELCRPKFYYPTREPAWSEVNLDGVTERVGLHRGRIQISRIPYLRLRQLLPYPLDDFSYATTIRILQKQLNQLPLVDDQDFPGCPPRSQAMLNLLQRCRMHPRQEIALLLGETGAGKELAARYLHGVLSPPGAPFCAVNLGAENPDLITSTLFGHARGAFTGAQSERKGVFLTAGRGTVFLDEIDKLPLPVQAVLLRVLQEREFRPVGSDRVVRLQCQVIVAANRDLELLCQSGQFHSDLYYRISAFRYDLPPLRERLADILPLAQYFVKLYSEKYRKAISGIDEALESFLLKYDWPGNVRELENFIKQQIAFQPGPLLCYELVDRRITARVDPDASALEARIKGIIETTLKDAGGNIKDAARLLGMNYHTLYSRIQKLGLSSRDTDR